MTIQRDFAANLMIVAACFIIVIAGVKAAADMLIPFLLSIFIAVLTAPFMQWLTQQRVPAFAAVLIMVAALVGLGVGLSLFLGGTINAFYGDIPTYEAKLQILIREAAAWLAGFGVEVPDNLIKEYVNPGVAMELVAGVFNGLGSVLTNAFLILFTVVFILLEASGMPSKMRRAFGEQTQALDHFERFTDLVQRYLAIKSLMSLGTGMSVGVALWIIGVDYAPVWALVAFLLNYIPNIGSIIAAVPAVLVALIQLGLGEAAAAAVCYVVVNTLFGNVIEPRLMGRTLGLSTLVVFLSLVFWGWVLGPVGMLLSIPLTMVVKIALETSPSSRWVAVLLDQ